MVSGFFEPSAWTRQRQPLQLVAQCGQCGLHKGCHSPFMKPTGKGKKRVLIVAEAPGANEDREGIQLIGNAGRKLAWVLENIGVDLRQDCWLTNAVICRPIGKGDRNRTPDSKEIGYCRPNLQKTIEALKPSVIIPLGKVACESLMMLAWKDGEVSDVGRWAGWQIPCHKLNAWICPTYHPSYLLHEKEPAHELVVTQHLRDAFALQDKPWPNGPDYKQRLLIEMDDRLAADHVSTFHQVGNPIAFDYETDRLKPDHKESQILCCSISDGVISVAFPWRGRVIGAMSGLLLSKVPKIAANLKFEERWTMAKMGHRIRNWHWDTMVAAHWLDCRRGITSLKFQSFVQFGAEDYDRLVEPFRTGKDKGGNSVNRLKEIDKEVLLTYCAMDSLLEHRLAMRQRQ